MTTLTTFPSSTFPIAGHGFSAAPSFGILSTYPPTPCGLATFSAALASGLGIHGADVGVVRVSDGPPSESARVIGELVNGSSASVTACTELLNQRDVAVIQHEYGIYGGVDGDEVVSCRIVLSAVASHPLEATAAEEFLKGKRVSTDTLRETAELAAKPAKPLDNADLSHFWRKRMVRVVVEQALARTATKSGGSVVKLSGL